MARKFLDGNCAECGGPLRYPAEQVGTLGRCPHCGKETELLLATPNVESGVPRRAIVVIVVATIILVGGLIGAMVALKRAQNWAARQSKPKPRTESVVLPVPPAVSAMIGAGSEMEGLGISSIALEKSGGAGISHATGFATNLLERARNNLRLEVDLLNSAGAKVGIGMDSIRTLKPGEVWPFRAPILVTNAVRARVSAIVEQ